MKNIKPKRLLVSLLALFVLGSFKRPLKATEAFTEDKADRSSVTTDRKSFLANTAILSGNVELTSKKRIDDNLKIGGNVRLIKPLPTNPLPVGYDKTFISKFLSFENSEKKEYYKYDSISHIFKNIEVLEKKRGIDPVRFRLSTNKDIVAIGEEFEIRITAEFLDINPRLIFQAEGSNEFTLKMIMPEGFVWTGGDYFDFIRGKVSVEDRSKQYLIKGYFEKHSDFHEFKLLRSHVNASINDVYYKPASIVIKTYLY